MQSSTTFENELRRIFDDMDCFEQDGLKYVGRAFYGKIDDDLILKAEYVSLRVLDCYSALKLEVLNRDEGVLDSNIIHFSEIWGRKPTDNPNYKNGVHPRLEKDGDKLNWCIYTPTGHDMWQLREVVADYVSVYQGFNMDVGMGGMQGM